MGRPVITEDTGATAYLPGQNGFRFVCDLQSAMQAVHEVMADWHSLSQSAHKAALELFDSTKNLRKILQI